MKRQLGKIASLPGNNEDVLQLAAEGAQLGLWYWDELKQQLDWDLKTCEMFGVSPNAEITLQTFLNALHPDDRDRVMQRWRYCLEAGVPYSMEMRALRPDGIVCWIDGRGKGYYGKSGEPLFMVGVALDITERKQAEQELATASKRLQLAMESGSVGGWDYDAKTGKAVLFGMALEQLGMSPDETSGSREEFWDHVHEDDRERYRSAIAAAREKKKHFDGEFRVVWRDGTIRWLRTRGRYYYAADGDPERLLGISVDITERKQAEQALRELNHNLEAQATQLQSREELLRVFVKNVPAAVAMLDRDMRYLQVSDRWVVDYLPGIVKILGCSHYEIFPDMPERWKEVHRRALQGETLRADEDYWEGQDGPHWARWEVRPWQNADGTIGGILIFAEDITRRKQMEEAISGISRKMIESQEQERLRIARELHDDVSQQLALLAVELDQWDHSSPDNPGVHHHLEHAKRRITDIAHDVQNLSHQLHSSKLEYLGLVAAARSFSKEVAEKNNVSVDFKEHGVPRSLSKEVSLSLFRILQQALHNAVAHSGAKHIEVRLWEDSDEVHLTVKESGRGFDLFSAMQRGGLGLTSMRERARLIDGEIEIDSQPMRGTTIHVRVPSDAEADSQRAAV
jgi:PAS domain S-box-containing protein